MFEKLLRTQRDENKQRKVSEARAARGHAGQDRPVKFVSCPHRVRRERPPSVVLVAMMSLSLLIPPEWIAKSSDVQHTFSASKVPSQSRSCSHMPDSAWRCRRTSGCSDSSGATGPWRWRLSGSFRLTTTEEMSCHSTCFGATGEASWFACDEMKSRKLNVNGQRGGCWGDFCVYDVITGK